MTISGKGPLRLGTRKSLMATTQSQLVADALSQRTGHAVELVGVTTEGDVSKALLAQIGGTGVFVNGLREKLLSGEVDFAVHSLKDLPTGPADGIVLAATPRRDDPRDALCGPSKLADLPSGARIGTGSPRREAQLRALRPDLEVVPIRGNAETRLRKVTDGELDAVVLAYAGLRRIGRSWRRSPRSSTPTRCCPRPARARSRWSAGPTGPTSARCSERWTIRRRGRPSQPSARCWPSSKRDVRRPWEHTLPK